MTLIYEAKTDGSNAVGYIPYSLVRFYLDQAYLNANQAKEEHQEGKLFPSSITGIMFSAMALEAFINEISESIISSDDLNDFQFLRGKYKSKGKESSLATKCRILFQEKHNYTIESDIKIRIKRLTELRNNLIHYKISEMSAKQILPPVHNTELEGGRRMTTIDFMVEPESYEPPFIQKVSGNASAECFNVSLSIIKKWGKLLGDLDYVPGLEEIVLRP